MQRKGVPLEPILRQGVVSFGSALQGVLDVLTDHEMRLQRLEAAGSNPVSTLDLSHALTTLEAKIQALTDEGKRLLAYDYFMLLCDCLGVPMEAQS